ncbi:hypothetical protein Salat_2998500 [Sesamum alatum]|uniref:Uncharacterized protein n=1 Tax=Sesamum alatum TaxID=300844 RepID=A0AAE2C7K3_9LAMI|nr:hypothetical protein Salat_2998500 [Sesamum alatum]
MGQSGLEEVVPRMSRSTGIPSSPASCSFDEPDSSRTLSSPLAVSLTGLCNSFITGAILPRRMCYSFLSLYGVNYSGLQMFSSKRWVSVPKSLFSLPYGLDPFHRYCSTVPDVSERRALL